MTGRDEESEEGFLDQYGSSIRSSTQENEDNKSSNTSKTRSPEKREDTNEAEQETEADQTDDSGKADPSGSSGAMQNDAEVPVKDRNSVLMYLPDDVWQELDIRFDELNAEHKRKHGEALEKNRDYYPAVIQAGLTDKDLDDILDL